MQWSSKIYKLADKVVWFLEKPILHLTERDYAKTVHGFLKIALFILKFSKIGKQKKAKTLQTQKADFLQFCAMSVIE